MKCRIKSWVNKMDKTKQQIKKNILGAEAIFHAQMASARDYIINELEK